MSDEERAQAREREVMAAVAGEILDVVHTLAAALAVLPEPYGEAGRAAFDYEESARVRFGTDTTDLSTVSAQLTCDQPRCRAGVRAATVDASRAAADALGWAVGIEGESRLTDLCPAHRAPA